MDGWMEGGREGKWRRDEVGVRRGGREIGISVRAVAAPLKCADGCFQRRGMPRFRAV